MKFDPATDVPKGAELVGANPVPEPKLTELRELVSIRDDAQKRFKDLNLRALELQAQYVQNDTVIGGELIKLAWKFGWDSMATPILDEEKGFLYGLKATAHEHTDPSNA